MFWNTKYKKQIKELENRIHTLKQAGWYTINCCEWIINNKDKDWYHDNPYDYFRVRKVFSEDKPIDNKQRLIIDDTYWKCNF